jgi:hypothetical protein
MVMGGSVVAFDWDIAVEMERWYVIESRAKVDGQK